jgi:Spy/CpxP family protein refolding chaperone
MKKIIAGLFAIAAFTFSASAQDQTTTDQNKQDHQKHGMHRAHDGRGMEAMQKLNLTDAQKQQMKSINEEFKTKMQALRQNDKSVSADAKSQRKALMEDRKSRITAILTPEQRTQFGQFQKEHGEGRKGDWKEKNKDGDWKQKRKSEDGKEKVKVKTT